MASDCQVVGISRNSPTSASVDWRVPCQANPDNKWGPTSFMCFGVNKFSRFTLHKKRPDFFEEPGLRHATNYYTSSGDHSINLSLIFNSSSKALQRQNYANSGSQACFPEMLRLLLGDTSQSQKPQCCNYWNHASARHRPLSVSYTVGQLRQ